MPIRRYRSLDDAEDDLWVPKGDPSLARRIDAVLGLGRQLCPIPPPRGLRLFRTIEEANAVREAWTTERMRALRARVVRERPKDDVDRE